MKASTLLCLLASASATSLSQHSSSVFRPPKHKPLNFFEFPTGDNMAEAYPEEFTAESIEEAEKELKTKMKDPRSIYN